MQKELFELEAQKYKRPLIEGSLPFNRVRQENWDFKGAMASTDVYGIHPYPAMFHFLLVRELINSFSTEGDTILDPFLGSGVTAVESAINNRTFIGFDINPLAVLITKVRTTPLPQRLVLETLDEIERNTRRTAPEAVTFHNIDFWFDEIIIASLSQLRQALFAVADEKMRDFFKVVFSEVVRRVSKTSYNEFKLVREKKPQPAANVSGTFREVALKNIGLLSEFYRKQPVFESSLSLHNHNILDSGIIPDQTIDLVVTSPPYGDSKTTVAYGQFSRLSLRWLGLEETVDRTSLGGKAKEITSTLPSPILYEYLEKIARKDEKRAREVFAFYDDLFDAVKTIAEKVKPSGHICFVVGNRTVKGEQLPTDKISADFFAHAGCRHKKTAVRAILNKRMPSENSPSNIAGQKNSTMRFEYIVVLEKRRC